MKYYLFPAIIFFSFNSCIVEMEEYTTYFEKQVVVNSLINPAEDFSCILVYTTSVYDTILHPVENAVITIYNGGNLIAPLDYQSEGKYQSVGVKPLPNNHYRIEIQVPGYETIWGETMIPPIVPLDTAYYLEETLWDDPYNFYLDEGVVTFKDPADEVNYYEWQIFRYKPYALYDEILNDMIPNYDSMGYYVPFWRILYNDPALINEGLMETSPSSLLCADALINGRDITLHFNYKLYPITNPGWVMKELEKVLIYQRTLSPEYYHFYKSFYRHRFEQGKTDITASNGVEGFDISSSAINLYSNVNGALGIFAGYSFVVKEMYKAN